MIISCLELLQIKYHSGHQWVLTYVDNKSGVSASFVIEQNHKIVFDIEQMDINVPILTRNWHDWKHI